MAELNSISCRQKSQPVYLEIWAEMVSASITLSPDPVTNRHLLITSF